MYLTQLLTLAASHYVTDTLEQFCDRNGSHVKIKKNNCEIEVDRFTNWYHCIRNTLYGCVQDVIALRRM